MADVLSQLSQAIDSLVGLDVNTLTDDELHEYAVGLLREADRQAAVRAEILAVWDARKVWAADGSKAGSARLARECSLDLRTARRELGRARKLGCMPVVAREVKTGGLSLDQADLLGRANTADFASLYQRDEQVLIDAIRPLRHRDAARVIEYWRQLAADETGQEPECCKCSRRKATAVRRFDGWIDVSATLDPLGGTEFLAALDRIEHELFDLDRTTATDIGPDGHPILTRTSAPRRADARVEMARRSAAMPPDARAR